MIRAALRGAAVLLLRIGIVGYQMLLSPLIGPSCRFAPSCSRYALEAIDVHGPVRGCALAVRRILRCHPFHPGGFDPVPGARPQDLVAEFPAGNNDRPGGA